VRRAAEPVTAPTLPRAAANDGRRSGTRRMRSISEAAVVNRVARHSRFVRNWPSFTVAEQRKLSGYKPALPGHRAGRVHLPRSRTVLAAWLCTEGGLDTHPIPVQAHCFALHPSFFLHGVPRRWCPILAIAYRIWPLKTKGNAWRSPSRLAGESPLAPNGASASRHRWSGRGTSWPSCLGKLSWASFPAPWKGCSLSTEPGRRGEP
jgi:hypothetical protein